MNMFVHELKAYRKSTLIWTVSMVLMVIFFLSLFPAIANDAAQFKKLLESYPAGIRKAFGISIDSVTSLLGFYSYVFGYVVLCGAIQAMNLGTSILSKEVREKTADFLLTKPVTRSQVLTAKLLASFVSLLITNVIYLAAASMMASFVSEQTVAWEVFILISITAFLVELMFLILGILVSAFVSRIKTVLPLSLSVVFGFFILNMFSSVIGDKALRYMTPFKYYDTAYIISHSRYEPRFILVETAFILAAVAASYAIYVKKDIHSV